MLKGAHAEASSSCSAAGSDSSKACSSSLSRASSASLLANELSASLMAFARDIRFPSCLLRMLLCASAEGTEDGLVDETRAASRTFASAITNEVQLRSGHRRENRMHPLISYVHRRRLSSWQSQ